MKTKKITTTSLPLKKILSVTAVIFVVGAISLLGLRMLKPSSALSAGQAAVSMDPSGGSFSDGAVIPVAVIVSSGTTKVSVVHTVITYPASQLQVDSITNSGGFPTVQRENKTSGQVDLIRGTGGGDPGVAGNNTVVTINFKVIGTTGAVPIAFTNASEAFDDSGSGTNIINISASTGANFSIVPAGSASLYRMANWKTKERLFTTSWPEVIAAQENDSGWIYEAIAMNVYSATGANRTPVYRMANWKTKERLFTTDYNEAQYALSHYEGWVNEGIAFYASTNTANTPVYRLANFITKERLFTTDANERNTIKDKNGWVYEGIAFYAAP